MQKKKKNAENIKPRFLKTKSDKAMILSTCAVCGSKNQGLLKKQEAKGLICLSLTTPLIEIPV